MDVKSHCRMLIAIPVPFGSTVTWLICRHLGSGMVAAFGVAFMFGLFSLAAIAIIEHEQTRRASLPYRTGHVLARAEAQNRRRYSRAQTRRIGRLANGENYIPDKATDLTEVIYAIGEPEVAPTSTDPRREASKLPEKVSQSDNQRSGYIKPDDFNDVSPTYLSSDSPLA